MRKPVVAIAAWRQHIELLSSRMTIFQVDELYVSRVRLAGAAPVLLPHYDIDEVSQIVGMLDGLVLTGGDDVAPVSYGASDEGTSIGCSVVADRSEIALLRSAKDVGLPVLGICRGVQILNVAFGGTLSQEITMEGRAQHPPRPNTLDEILAHRHVIEVREGTRLAKLGQSHRLVNSTHHQAIEVLAPGFRISAFAPDGTIEAIEAEDDSCFWGVQWHPEKLSHPVDQDLFEDLVAAAEVRAEKRL